MATNEPRRRRGVGREGPLARWTHVVAHHPWRVVAGWVVAIAAVAVIATAAGGRYIDAFTIPDAESQAAVDLLEERFPSQAGDSATLVVETDSQAGVTDPAIRARVEALVAEAATLPEVVGVASPYETPGAVSADGRIAYATVQYAVGADEVEDGSVDALTALVDRSEVAGLRVEVGGQVISSSEQAVPASSELVGLAAAVVIMLVAFGSVVAMGMPIVSALAGLGIGLLSITLAARVFDMSSFTPAFAAMIGLGVGIDYALLVVTRFREDLRGGLTVEGAAVRAVETAGRSVIFAGSIVVIALLGLFSVGLPFVAAIGVAGALVVAASVLVAVGLLPALLVLVGRNIERWSVPGPGRRAAAVETTVGYRLVRRIQRRPLAGLGAGVLFMLVLAAPILDLRLGFGDNGNNPESFRSRQAYDLLAEGFGPGFNGPLLLAVEQPGGLDPATLDGLTAAIGAAEGVAAVSPAMPNPENDTAVITVVPTTSPQDAETDALIGRLRDEVIPASLGGSPMDAYVGGATATFVDIGDRITERLPLFIGVVLGLSILVLMAVFRSVVIPLKAAVMNLLSVGAAYGVLVAVFQWGWAGDLLGIDKTGPIESFLPMMLFAILFGLSMDYEVFLVTRIREAYLKDGNTHDALAHGLGATGRVILAAGAIMAAVFLAFFLDPTRVIKEFGLGLATAIVVDVAVVRMILVPAAMELLGERNWWFPSWLDRRIPRLDVEGERRPAPAFAEAD